MPSDDPFARAGALLRNAQHVVVFTGAGMSVDSGLGTYRTGSDPLWTEESMQRYANPDGFRQHAEEAWRWYDARRRAMSAAAPNEGHRVIAELEGKIPRVVVVTQNIDSLHQRAGSEDVIELHGSLAGARCRGCDTRALWPDPSQRPASTRCACGDVLMPDVIMFTEMLDQERWARAESELDAADLVLSVGTSATVYPAAELIAARAYSGKPLAIVNPDLAGQPVGPKTIPIASSASEAFTALRDAAFGR